VPYEGEQIGHYQFLCLLGSGNISEVYLAKDTELDREVAIKVVRADITPYHAKSEASRLFQREMKAISMLNDPHVLTLYDYGESNVQGMALSYMVTPYHADGSLAIWLHRRDVTNPLSFQEIASIIAQAASALQHAHSLGILHLDVKPANFLLQYDEEDPSHLHLLLADFGFARFTTPTASLAIRGTPTYMAPEQWKGHPVSATDQYALAVMAYELLTGGPPFQGSFSQIMRQHINTQLQPPSSINAQLSTELDAVLLRALDKDPQGRFPTISAFADAFQQVLQGIGLAETVSRSTPKSEADIPMTTSALTSHHSSGQSAPLELSPPSRGKTGFGLLSTQGKLIRGKVLWRTGIGIVLLLMFSGTWVFLNAVHHTRQPATLNLHTTTALANAAATVYPTVNPSVIAANPDPYPPGGGTLALYDPLRDDSSGYRWDEAQPNCTFMGGSYYVTTLDQPILPILGCNAGLTNFSNFAYEVQMKIIKGDAGGLMFRVVTTMNANYVFFVSQNGTYSLYLYRGAASSNVTTLTSNFSSAIKRGLNQVNLIAVVAKGRTITLYVNHQQIDSVNDSTYQQGQIGLVAGSIAGTPTPTIVVYSNAKVWTI
jgi:serine/threonine protein kinase